MRIISGQYGGRRLVSFEAKHLRPTTDRTKESIFSKIAELIPQARVLDLFAGTGSLGLEALSRGADHVDFVESHRKSLKIIKQNIQLLDIQSDCYQVHFMDVFKYLKAYSGPAYQIIFADPPFTEKIADRVGQAVGSSSVGRAGSIWMMESGGAELVGETYGPWQLMDRRDFGDKVVSFFGLSD